VAKTASPDLHRYFSGQITPLVYLSALIHRRFTYYVQLLGNCTVHHMRGWIKECDLYSQQNRLVSLAVCVHQSQRLNDIMESTYVH
jgi:hypothetical protein